MSKVELALQRHHSKKDVVPLPLTIEQLCSQAWPSLQKAFNDLKDPSVQESFLKLVEAQGGSEWIFRIIYNPTIYDEVSKHGSQLKLSLNNINGFDYCTLYMENNKEVTDDIANIPNQIPDTLIKIKYEKPWYLWFWF
jgi:hypothetical protein